MLMNLFYGGVAVNLFSIFAYLFVEFKTFNLTERFSFKKFLSRLWEEKVVFLVTLIPVVNYISTLVILKDVIEMLKEGGNSISESLGIELNRMYECTNPDCSMICREYHLIKNSQFHLTDCCPFCKSEDYSLIRMGPEYDRVSKLSLAEAIPEKEEKEFLIRTKNNWLDIEEKQRELEVLKLTYDLEKRQLDNYLRLNTNKADKMITEYQMKLDSLQEEYDSFSRTIEEDIMLNLYGKKK